MSKPSTLGFANLPGAFWAALFVLVLNDHALKGSGVLPGIITGKLSDFAGLIVAPVLLCAALSVRSDRTRGLLLGLVALGFAAIKLSPALADGASAALTALGIPSRIWCDPTDLIAFAVLPYAARLAQRVEPLPARWSRRCAITVAACACVATSEVGPQDAQLRGPFVINWTHGLVDVAVSKRTTACGLPAEETSEPIAERVTLCPACMLELGRDLPVTDAGISECGVVEVRVADQKTRVTWEPPASEPLERAVMSESAPDAGVSRTWRITHADAWAFERGIVVYGSAAVPAFDVGALLNERDAP